MNRRPLTATTRHSICIWCVFGYPDTPVRLQRSPADTSRYKTSLRCSCIGSAPERRSRAFLSDSDPRDAPSLRGTQGQTQTPFRRGLVTWVRVSKHRLLPTQVRPSPANVKPSTHSQRKDPGWLLQTLNGPQIWGLSEHSSTSDTHRKELKIGFNSEVFSSEQTTVL